MLLNIHDLMRNEERLFFIMGIGRSGTTLLQELMNTFDGFCNDTESIDLKNMVSFWMPVQTSNDFSLLENFIEKNWTRKYFVEKMPTSILCLPQLLNRFPKSNYLFLERDPMDIVLSQITLPAIDEDRREEFHVKNFIMEKEDLDLNKEQYWAKLTLKLTNVQTLYKHKFKKAVTIRYENLIQSLDSHLELIKNTFKVNPDFERARQVLSRPTKSPKSTHEVNELTDELAIEMVKQARRLWDY